MKKPMRLLAKMQSMSEKERGEEREGVGKEEEFVRLALSLSELWDWNFFEAKPETVSR